jgi:hypothetical protein
VSIDVVVENELNGDDFSAFISAELRVRTLTLAARIDTLEPPSKPWWAPESWRGWDEYLAEDPDDEWRKEPQVDPLEYSQTLWPRVVDVVSGEEWKTLDTRCDEWVTKSRDVLLVLVHINSGRGLILALQPGSTTKYVRIGVFEQKYSHISEDIIWEEMDVTVV